MAPCLGLVVSVVVVVVLLLGFLAARTAVNLKVRFKK
jgi:hypothetical protein